MPRYVDASGAARVASMIVVAYGKLGGLELGYGSDLDLVFLHDSSGEAQRTDGAQPIDNTLFFQRLGQRLVHLLTVHSASGRLYEVDTRLRPAGNRGLLVQSLAAFRDYEFQDAGPGNTSRCCVRVRLPGRRSCASNSRRPASRCCARP